MLCACPESALPLNYILHSVIFFQYKVGTGEIEQSVSSCLASAKTLDSIPISHIKGRKKRSYQALENSSSSLHRGLKVFSGLD